MNTQYSLLRLTVAGILLAGAGIFGFASGISGPLVVSAYDPLLTTCDMSGGSEAETGERDWEAEPTLVVNPNDAANLITAWTQDFADGIVAAYSLDGGQSWHESIVSQKFCTSSDSDLQQWGSAYDSVLAFGRNGTAYLSSILVGSNGTAAAVSISTDGGQTWPRQSIVHFAPGGAGLQADDHTTMLADPTRPNVAYVGWDKITGAGVPLASAQPSRVPFIARTDDGGTTWSPVVDIFASANYTPPPGMLELGHVLLAEPDGTLLDLFTLIPATNDPQSLHGPAVLMGMTSVYPGDHWSAPTTLFTQPDPTQNVANFGFAVAPDGTIHVGWQQDNSSALGSSTTTTIMHMTVTRLANGQLQPSAPNTITTVNERPMIAAHGVLAAPMLAARPDGTLGVMFYDHRKNVAANYPSGDLPHITNLWVRFSRDAGRTWPDAQERHIGGSFDIGTAPDADGYNKSCTACQPTDGAPAPFVGGPPVPHTYGNGFLGDYWGFIPVASGFAMSFGEANPITDPAHPENNLPHNTDIYFSKVSLEVPVSRVVSRKTHGTAGTFDIDLPQTGTLGIEPRDGTGKGNYTMLFTFQNNLTSVGSATVSSGTGKVASSAIALDRHQYIVNLTGVTNAQRITVSLGDITDSDGNTSRAISATMGILIGDVNGDGAVTSTDVDQVKAQSNQRVTTANFRDDVTVDGTINGTDMSLVKSKLGTSLH